MEAKNEEKELKRKTDNVEFVETSRLSFLEENFGRLLVNRQFSKRLLDKEDNKREQRKTKEAAFVLKTVFKAANVDFRWREEDGLSPSVCVTIPIDP